jgi:glycosyltransferase involved in cell wall biosynthesis
MYIISGIHKSYAFEWIADYLDKDRFELHFILLNQADSTLESYLRSKAFKVNRITYRNKFDIPKALIANIFLLLKNRPKMVHAHLFDAGLIGLTAAWICRIKKRIYTRHHSAFHHDHFPKAVKYDRLCNRLATHLVSVSKNVTAILNQKEQVPLSKINLIHHGFKLELFSNVSDKEIFELKQKYSTEGYFPVLGVIARYTEWKGVQFIIPAFKKLLSEYPRAKLILANASGDYQSAIHDLLIDIPKEQVEEIPFEENLFALYKCFDLFIHTPIESDVEAFGQVYIEALASSIPSVFTLSGIANDFIEDRRNALVVDYCNAEAIFIAMKEILGDESLVKKITEQGRDDVHHLFPLSKMIKQLEALYSN